MDLQLIEKKVLSDDQIDPFVKQIWSMSSAYRQDEICLALYAPEATSYKSRYTGTGAHSSWITKCKATLEGISLLDTSSRAILLDKEIGISMLELANEIMLISVFPLAILISKNYEISIRVDDRD